MYENLITRADQLQRAARRLFDQLPLFALWEAYGLPILVGAVQTGLMVEPNIDLNVIMDAPSLDACFAVLRAVGNDTAHFDDLFIRNHLHDSTPTLYVGIGYQFAGELWIIDNLIFGKQHPHRSFAHQTTEAIRRGLDAQTRLRILQIKNQRLHTHGRHMGGGRGLDSLDIYRAVFDGGAATYAECESWAAGHPRDEYVLWLPPTEEHEDAG